MYALIYTGLFQYKIQEFIEPILAPKGATKIYKHRKEDDQKDRTHVYKMKNDDENIVYIFYYKKGVCHSPYGKM